MTGTHEQLRVAFVAGQLVQSGAEKQLVYMARALRQAGVQVRVYCLTQGDYYEATLRALDIELVWIGQMRNPAARLAVLQAALARYQPHILQSANFFTNLYISLSSLARGPLTIGAIRNNTLLEFKMYGKWAPWLLRGPSVLVANSEVAKRNAVLAGVRPENMYVLPNVIDLVDFDAQASQDVDLKNIKQPIAVAVGRLVPEKRMDRFLHAIALAAKEIVDLKGILIGDGPEKARLESLANDLGLLPDRLLMFGHCTQVPAVIRQANLLVLCSDHEGFPNVLLEAMAARLPVITTPAGDADLVVQNQVTGYVTAFDNTAAIARLIVRLVQAPELSRQLGQAGRKRVEQSYSSTNLADRLLAVYQSAAEQQGRQRLLRLLAV